MTIRDTCGTARGAMAHGRAGERLCGWCAQAERVALLAAELIPVPERRPEQVWAPVTAEDAARHCRELAAEVDAFEKSHPEGHSNHWRKETAVVVSLQGKRRGAA